MSGGEQLIAVIAFGLFFVGEIGLIVTIMMIATGHRPEPRAHRPKGPVARASFREVTASLRQFRNLSRKD